MNLSDTHLMVLNAAAAREDKLVTKHKRLPGASLQKVCAVLVKRGLLAELTGVSPDPDVLHMKTDLGNTEYAITPAGLAAIGVDDESPYGEDLPKDVRAGVDPFRIDGPDNNPPDEAATAPTGAEDAPGASTPAAGDTARPAATTAPTRARACATPRTRSSRPGTTRRTARRTSSPRSKGRWRYCARPLPEPRVPAASPAHRARRARARSRRRCSDSSAVPRARRSPRSSAPPDGSRTPCAASSPT